MPDGSLAYGQRRHFTVDDLTQQWVWRIGLAAAVALGYFLAAALSVRLVLTPDGVPAFWPGAGLSAGVLIALGPRARWPVLAGVLVGDCCDPSYHQGAPLGSSLGLMQLGRRTHYSRTDPALLRFGFQPRSAAPNH
jgi:hypothetical protein